MADDSELDYLRTFIGEVMTGFTIKHYSETKNLSKIADVQRGLVDMGEIIRMDDVYYVKRYPFSFAAESEIVVTTGLKNLIAGARNYNRRVAGPTQVASMCYIDLIPIGNPTEEGGRNKRWKMYVNIDVYWSVS